MGTGRSGFFFAGEKAGYQEEGGGGADGGVGDIERWPVTIPREDDIEKIDNITVEDAVGEVSKHAGDKQGRSDARRGVCKGASPREDGHQHEGHRGKNHEKQVVVFQHAEGGSGVVDLDEVEDARDDRHEFVCRNEAQNEPFRNLVKQVER